MKRLYYKLVGHTSRRSYWGHSSFAAWIRKVGGCTPTPTSATAEGWCEHDKENEGKICHWITDELLDNIQDIVYFPHDVYLNFYYIARNYFVDKSHVLQTGLTRGEYHGYPALIEHGLFKAIVDFVEIEKAHMHRMGLELEGKRRKRRWEPSRSREDGLAHLEWEISLGAESPHQSEHAQKVKDVYLWIKDVYPNRPDPGDLSGWNQYCDDRRKNKVGKSFFCTFEKTDEERDQTRQMLDEYNKIEQEQTDEVTKYLIQIAEMRNGLWT